MLVYVTQFDLLLQEMENPKTSDRPGPSKHGGSYCCIPQCNSSSSKGIKLYKVPIGKKDLEFALKIGQINFRKLVKSFFIKIFIYFTY